jgi:chondroitin 4-sulfotransferase 11
MENMRYRLLYYDYLFRQRVAGRYVFIHINKCGGTSVESALGIPVKIHDTALARRKKIGRRRWEQAFTFALVRHPYSKVISHYKYRIKTNQTAMREAPIALNEWIRKSYQDKDRHYYDQPLMFAPCFHWVTDQNGDVIVDYIAKLETIATDWPIIQERIGQEAPLPVKNISGSEFGWKDLDATARRIIQGHFRKDFEMFGYEA